MIFRPKAPSILDMLGFLKAIGRSKNEGIKRGAIEYGDQKQDGTHDHRNNKGGDRTPRQKEGDRKRRKDQ